MTPLWIEINEPEPYCYGEQIYNKVKKQTGVVMSADGDTVRARYYNLISGRLERYDEECSTSDLINDSSK